MTVKAAAFLVMGLPETVARFCLGTLTHTNQTTN